jgi:organic hydroperoxide reductase OsmC/OhrA
MKTVRVYCRVDDRSVVQQIQTCFGKLCRFLEEKAKYNTTPAKTQALEIEAEVNETSDFNVLTQSPILNDDQSPLPSLGKRSSSQSFYSQAVKRKIVDDMK